MSVENAASGSGFIQDPNNPKKQIGWSGPHPSVAGIPTFATETLAKVSKPTAGTMTFEIASGKIWIYDGTTWQSFVKDS